MFLQFSNNPIQLQLINREPRFSSKKYGLYLRGAGMKYWNKPIIIENSAQKKIIKKMERF